MCFEYGGGLLHQEQRASDQAAQRVVAERPEAFGFVGGFREGGVQLEVYAMGGVDVAHAGELKEALRKGQDDGTVASQVFLSRGDEA